MSYSIAINFPESYDSDGERWSASPGERVLYWLKSSRKESEEHNTELRVSVQGGAADRKAR